MHRQPAPEVEIRLIVQFLKYLRIKHPDDIIIGLVGIRYHTEQCRFGLSIPIDANAKLRKVQLIP